MNQNTARSIDGFKQAGPAPVRPAAVAPQFRPVAPRIYARPQPTTRSRGLPDWIQLPLIIIGGMIAGLSIQSPALGQAAIVVYGLFAITLRIPSRTTFALALLSMIATTVFLVVRGDVAMAQNFATYTFLLLVVGVITLNRELKREGGRIYSRRTNGNS